MNIADCTQSEPTQMPSLSSAPTICYALDITFVDGTPSEPNWEATLRRVASDGFTEIETFEDEVVESDEDLQNWHYLQYDSYHLCTNVEPRVTNLFFRLKARVLLTAIYSDIFASLMP
ncbi:hypothetical protein ACHAWF_012890 [Thalassiosira exigua]